MRCDKCPLHIGAKQIVQGLGPPFGDIMVVGMNPGKQEDLDGFPFSGGSGRILDKLLYASGIRRSACWVTNVVKCTTPGNRRPNTEELLACKPHLMKEMDMFKPNVVIALGDVALEMLCGKKGITKYRGSILPVASWISHKCKVVPTFHPSYLMRGQQHFWSTVEADMAKALKHSTSPEISLVETHYETYDGNTGDTWIKDNLMNSSIPISFDIETPGVLQPWKGRPLGISFSWAEGCAMNFNWYKNFHIIKAIMEGPAPKIVQRGTFDVYYMMYWGVKTNNLWFDTKVGQHLLAPQLPNDLAYLVSVHTDIPYYKPGGKGGGVMKMTAKELAKYNNEDADGTRRVAMEMVKETEEYGQTELMANQMLLVKTISKMQIRGVKVDLEAVRSELQHISETIDHTEELFLSKNINIRSGAQLGDLIIGLGFKLPKTKSGKQYRTNREALEKLAPHPVIKKILQFKTLDKLRSTFLNGMKQRLVEGRIHTTYSITGTKTGRLSSRDPNLQNVPEVVRNIFIPDGDVFVNADYKGFEVAMLAAICGDKKMQQDLDDGLRIHDIIGLECYGDRELEPAEKLRAKAVVFGTAYGRTAGSIAREFGCTKKEAERLQSIVLGKYPGVSQYLRRMEQTKVAKSIFNRVKHYEGMVTEMYNFPIQSSGSDVLLQAMNRVDETLSREDIGCLALTVHDNIVVDTDLNYVDDVITICKREMEMPIPEAHGKIFPISIKVGPNWRDLKSI